MDLQLQAQEILKDNWRDGFSIPTAKLYPFQWLGDSGFVAMGSGYFDLFVGHCPSLRQTVVSWQRCYGPERCQTCLCILYRTPAVAFAALQLESGNNIEAVRLFDSASTRFSLPRHSQLAEIKAAYILASEGQYSDVINRLGPLAQKDAPYEFLARELLGLSAFASGDKNVAREQFSYLEFIPGVPPNIRDRAKQSLSLMKANVINSDGAETENNSGSITTEKPDGN